MTPGTGLQWLTMAAFGVLLILSVWAWRRVRVRPMALALGLWGVNGLAFYVVFLFVYGATLHPVTVAWSALTRLQGIFLGIITLMILVKRDEADG
jgi:hypothetical protein